MSGFRLEAHVKNSLMARWIFYEVADKWRPTLSIDGNAALRAIENTLQERTAYSLASLEKKPTPQYMAELMSEIRSATGKFTRGDRARISAFLAELEENVNAVRTSSDDPIYRVCEGILATVVEAYRQVAVSPPQETMSAADFNIIFTDERPALAFPQLAGSMLTLPQVRSAAFSQVQIHLSVKEFDQLSFNAFPYAVFHECVSHVMQGPWNDSRELPDPSTLYAEGWMDFTAHLLYTGLLTGRILNVPLPELLFPELRRPSCVEAGTLMHYARRAESSSDRSWSYRAMGSQAAEWLLGRLRKLPRIGEPEQIFLQISFAINASELGQPDREEIVSLLHHILPRANLLADLTPALFEFAHRRDLSSLLTQIWQIGSESHKPKIRTAAPTGARRGARFQPLG